MHKLALSLIAIALASTPAHAIMQAEKVILADTVRDELGNPSVVMECNWLRNLKVNPVQVLAVYGEGETKREEEISVEAVPFGRRLNLTIPADKVTDELNYLRVLYSVNEENRCEGGYSPGVISQ